MFVTITVKFDKQAKKYNTIVINTDNINYVGNGEIMLNKGAVYVDEKDEKLLCKLLLSDDNNTNEDTKKGQTFYDNLKNMLHKRFKKKS